LKRQPPEGSPGVASDFEPFVEHTSALERMNCDSQAPFLPSRWNMTLGLGWGMTTATHVEMVLRKCPIGATAPEQAVYDHEYFPVVQVGTPSVIEGTEIYFDGAELDPNDQHPDFRYFVEVRPVKRVGNLTTKTWRWSVLGMSPNCAGFSWLRTLPGASGLVETRHFTCGDDEDVPLCPPPSGQGYGMNYVPSAVPQSRIPGGPGVLPDDPPN
jgi:hypothetical protein